MLSKRVASSTSSVARCARRPISRAGDVRVRSQQQAKRFQSTESTSSSSNAPAGGASPAVIGALTGSLATMSIGYLWYRQSGARDIVVASKTTKDYMKSAGKTIKDSTPEPNEALNWLRSTAKSYAMFIPGVGGYIDSAFDDLDAIREKHGQEVDDIVREACTELQGLARNDQFSLLTAQKAWNVIVKHLGRIGDLAGDAMEQIMDNHPQLKDKVGPNIDKLEEYGRNYGPEARKEVERTWEQVSDVVKTGTGAENIKKIQDIVQEKVEKLKRLGDEAWRKGMEQAKPHLERNPEVRKLVEENADALKSRNVQELYRKIKKAVESGDTADIEAYVKRAAGEAKDSGFAGLERYLGKVPGGDQIVPQLSQIGEVAQKHGDEAQKLLRDTVSEISEVLKKRGSEAEELANKAKENAK